jgi:hypothetical protein
MEELYRTLLKFKKEAEKERHETLRLENENAYRTLILGKKMPQLTTAFAPIFLMSDSSMSFEYILYFGLVALGWLLAVKFSKGSLANIEIWEIDDYIVTLEDLEKNRYSALTLYKLCHTEGIKI